LVNEIINILEHELLPKELDSKRISELEKELHKLCTECRIYRIQHECIRRQDKENEINLKENIKNLNDLNKRLRDIDSDRRREISILAPIMRDSKTGIISKDIYTPFDSEIEDIIEEIECVESYIRKHAGIRDMLHKSMSNLIDPTDEIRCLEAKIAELKSEPLTSKKTIETGLAGFNQILSVMKVFKHYIAYYNQHSLDISGMSNFTIDTWTIETLITPQISSAEYIHADLMEYVLFMFRVVSVCNEHHYHKLLETYVVPCKSSCNIVSSYMDKSIDYIIDPEFNNLYPGGGYKPGLDRCSHGHISEWSSKYGINRMNMYFNKDNTLEFTIFSTVPIGRKVLY
jgi:hypothetical protein